MAIEIRKLYGVFREKILNVDFAQFYYLNIEPAHN